MSHSDGNFTHLQIYQVTFPESTMNRIPSIVMEVSAMLVDTTHFRTPSGGTSNTCEKIFFVKWKEEKQKRLRTNDFTTCRKAFLWVSQLFSTFWPRKQMTKEIYETNIKY